MAHARSPVGTSACPPHFHGLEGSGGGGNSLRATPVSCRPASSPGGLLCAYLIYGVSLMPIEPTADPPPIVAGAVGGGRDRPGLAATGCGERVGGGEFTSVRDHGAICWRLLLPVGAVKSKTCPKPRAADLNHSQTQRFYGPFRVGEAIKLQAGKRRPAGRGPGGRQGMQASREAPSAEKGAVALEGAGGGYPARPGPPARQSAGNFERLLTGPGGRRRAAGGGGDLLCDGSLLQGCVVARLPCISGGD